MLRRLNRLEKYADKNKHANNSTHLWSCDSKRLTLCNWNWVLILSQPRTTLVSPKNTKRHTKTSEKHHGVLAFIRMNCCVQQIYRYAIWYIYGIDICKCPKIFITLRKILLRTINMGYWPSLRSRWLDIGQVLFLRVYGPRRSLWTETKSRSINKQKKNKLKGIYYTG